MSTPNGEYTRTNLAPQDENKGVHPRFYMESVQDELATAREGRPIFREEERIQMVMAGNPTFSPVFKVNDEHRHRWPRAYEAFRAGEEMALEGTPLEQWPILNRSQVKELKALEIHSVEQMAEVTDYNLQKIGMGGRALRDAAKAYLDDSARMSALTQAAKENENMRSEISTLRHQVEELSTLLNRSHGQLMAKNDELPTVDTALPFAADPVEMAKIAPTSAGAPASSLDALARRKPGRPRKAA